WMDIRMPDMDGLEATRRIRRRQKEDANKTVESADSRAAPEVKIIAVTAGVFEEERAASMVSGCDDFLPKPFHDAEAFDLMARHIGVRFVYEESVDAGPARRREVDKSVLTPERLNALPEKWIAPLKIAADRTDPGGSREAIDRLRPRDEPLADALAELVREYRFDIIQALFEEK
ncbi:MAG: response regulator, partial [Desulfobacterales bacterium]|nr:response regulator [Desulfobacterales bacterium]